MLESGHLFFSPPDTWGDRPVLVLVLYHILNREVGRATENFAVKACLLPHLAVVVHLKRLEQCHKTTLSTANP